jgi:hypothetical protein
LHTELGNAMRGDIAAQFTNALRNRFPAEIDHQAVDRMF